MTVTVNLAQLVTAVIGGVFSLLVILLPCVYWAVRTAIKSEAQALELRIMETYMRKSACKEIREECERHRHESAELMGLPRVKVGK